MEKKNECKHGEWKYEPKFNRDGASRFIFMKVGAVVCSFMKNIPHEHYNSIVRPVYCDITRQRECSRFEEREGPRAGLFYLYTDDLGYLKLRQHGTEKNLYIGKREYIDIEVMTYIVNKMNEGLRDGHTEDKA